MTGLTDAERQAMDCTAELTGIVCQRVIGHGPTRDSDIREFIDKIHQIQHVILSQAAARAHPDWYRLLGETLETP